MSTEESKAIVRRFVDQAQSRGNLNAIEEIFDPGFVDHGNPPGLPPTRDGVRQLFTMLWTAFPDLHATIHDQVGEGDKVVTRKTLSGTHRGDFMGIPPTGRSAAFDIIDIVRIRRGKIVEHW